jgi:hypothetical protein
MPCVENQIIHDARPANDSLAGADHASSVADNPADQA